MVPRQQCYAASGHAQHSGQIVAQSNVGVQRIQGLEVYVFPAPVVTRAARIGVFVRRLLRHAR
jgi:hypothetical protein